jgi:hypothetical protein
MYVKWDTLYISRSQPRMRTHKWRETYQWKYQGLLSREPTILAYHCWKLAVLANLWKDWPVLPGKDQIVMMVLRACCNLGTRCKSKLYTVTDQLHIPE